MGDQPARSGHELLKTWGNLHHEGSAIAARLV